MSLSVSLEDRIPYHDECAWKEYLAKVAKVVYLAKAVHELYQKLHNFVSENQDKTLEYLKQYPGLFKIVFSGFRPDPQKPFEDLALSRFYYDIYYFGLPEDTASGIAMELRKGNVNRVLNNPRFVITQLGRQHYYYGETVPGICSSIWSYADEAFKRLRDVELCSSSILLLVNNVSNDVEAIVSEMCESLETSEDRVYCGVKLLEELLKTGVELLPQFSKLSWFVVSLSNNIDIYIEEYYPNLWKSLKEGILKKLKISDCLKAYAIKGLSGVRIIKLGDYSPAAMLRYTIAYMFKLFQLDEIRRYFDVPDLFADYVTHSWGQLKKIGVIEDLRKLLKELRKVPTYSIDKCGNYSSFDFLRASSLKLPEKFGCYKICGWIEGVERKLLKAEDVLNVVVPMMMYGLAYIDIDGSIYLILTRKT